LSLLDSLRNTKIKSTNEPLSHFEQLQDNAPAISKQLLRYLDTVFDPKRLTPDDPNINNHLLFQHGIEHIKRHLKDLNERQERSARDTSK